MNVRDSDFDQLLAEWLEDDTTVAPAAPVEAAVNFAHAHPRRVDALAPLRRDAMTTRTSMGLRSVALVAATAALIVLTIAGGVLLATAPDSTPTPTISSTPAATASLGPTETPVAVLPMPTSGALAPGRYSIQVPDSDVAAELTIGSGWTSGGWYVMNPPDFTKQISFWTVGNVNADACDWAGTLPEPPTGPTADDLIAALDAQTHTDMSDPVDTTIGGFPAKHVSMLYSPEDDCGGDHATMWADANGEEGRGLELGSAADQLWIVEVNGQRIVIVAGYARGAGLGETDVSDVLDSIEFATDAR